MTGWVTAGSLTCRRATRGSVPERGRSRVSRSRSVAPTGGSGVTRRRPPSALPASIPPRRDRGGAGRGAGRPARRRSAELELSISHRAGRALAVIASPGAPVGCDLELVEERSTAFVESGSRRASRRSWGAAHDEQAWLANLFWSAKEAATKARGEGLRLDVRHAEVVRDPGRRCGRLAALHVGWG